MLRSLLGLLVVSVASSAQAYNEAEFAEVFQTFQYFIMTKSVVTTCLPVNTQTHERFLTSYNTQYVQTMQLLKRAYPNYSDTKISKILSDEVFFHTEGMKQIIEKITCKSPDLDGYLKFYYSKAKGH